VVANHLSRIPSQDLTEGPIHDSFPDEHLLHVNTLTFAPWYADIANYLAVGSIPSHWTKLDKQKFFRKVRTYF